MNQPKEKHGRFSLVVFGMVLTGLMGTASCTDKRHDCAWLASCPVSSAEVAGAAGVAGAPADACQGQCAAPTAVCRSATRTCVECSSDAHCRTTKPFCDATSGTCQQCLSDGQCKDPVPWCHPTNKACVECLSNADCKSEDASRCDTTTNTCVGCQKDDDCRQITGKARCWLGAPAASESSAQAGAHSAAGAAGQGGIGGYTGTIALRSGGGQAGTTSRAGAASQADATRLASAAGMFGSMEHAGAAGRATAGTTVLGAGRCVQCTAQNPSACGTLNGKPLICDSQTHQCTTYQANSAGLCQKCVADAQCKTGMLCYRQTFDGAEVGHFCFNKQNSLNVGIAGDCTATANRPYVKVQANAVSIDGEVATLCTLRATTCTSLLQFGSHACGTGIASDAACGFAPGTDSKCVEWGGSQYFCTTSCMTVDDCFTGTICDTGVSPRICRIQ